MTLTCIVFKNLKIENFQVGISKKLGIVFNLFNFEKHNLHIHILVFYKLCQNAFCNFFWDVNTYFEFFYVIVKKNIKLKKGLVS